MNSINTLQKRKQTSLYGRLYIVDLFFFFFRQHFSNFANMHLSSQITNHTYIHACRETLKSAA